MITALVPDDDPQRPWEDAAALGVAWINDAATRLGGDVVLVTNTFQNSAHLRSLQSLHRSAHHLTPASSGAGRGPTLAYVPAPAALGLALHTATTALCIVETHSTPVAGWAATTGAVNLVTGAPAEPLDPALQKLLGRLRLYGPSYSSRDDQAQARRIIEQIRSAHPSAVSMIASALAGESSSDGIARIAKLAGVARRQVMKRKPGSPSPQAKWRLRWAVERAIEGAGLCRQRLVDQEASAPRLDVFGLSDLADQQPDFPAPVVDRAGCVLWLRADVEAWAKT